MPNLVGIGNSQVPTNAMLGGLAYQDPAYANLTEVEIENIAAIKAKTSDTAVDIFVYDTRKDSDGGAWRKRTQHCSWYNEGESTTRGARKEFPAVAVIVGEDDKTTIYDADDPNLSMWMKFLTGDTGGDNIFNRPQYWDTKDVFALNGTVCITNKNGSAEALLVVNYVSDSATIYPIAGYPTYGGIYNSVISERANSSIGHQQISHNLVGDEMRGLSMTVEPEALIDPETGIPAPSIAVVTGHGVSVIRDDGTVKDITASAGSSYDRGNFVSFTESGHLIFEQDGSNGRSVFFTPVPTADRTSSTSDGSITDKVVLKPYANGNVDYPRFNEMLSTNSGIGQGIPMKGPDHALVSHAGKVTIVKPNINTPAKGMTAYITKDYNTGWMYGGCRNVWLAETDSSAIDNITKVSNGVFTSNINGWSGGGNTSLSNPSGTLRVTQTANGTWSGSTARTDMGTNFVVGKTYAVSYKIRSGGTSGNYSSGFGSRIQKYHGGTANYHSDRTLTYSQTTSDPGSSWVYWTWTFTAEATQYALEIYNWYGVNGSYFELDEVNVREAVVDHAYIQSNASHNQKNGLGNGLRLTGTGITRAPVYTGSELVYYTGFASGSSMWQEHNSNLNFGTDDCYMSVWAYGGGNSQCLMVKERPDTDAHGGMMIFQDGGVHKFYFRCNGQSSWGTVTSTAAFGNHWMHLYLVRRGSKVEGYCNGIFEGEASFSGTNGNGGSVAAEVAVGSRVINSFQTPFSGRLALAKIGKGSPTAAEIQKIYTDERKLFYPDSKCTLYGSSDVVTVMGYDKSTDILHLGTSAGRSDFIGLNRINNTTTAVTTAISASNGLVAEQ